VPTATEFNFLESIASIAPVVGLTVMAVVILLLDAYLGKQHRRGVAYVAALGTAAMAATPLIWAPRADMTVFWGGTIVYDGVTQIFQVMVCLAGAIACLMAIDDRGTRNRGEYHLIVIISTLGACLLVAANDLIMIFIALETVSIPLYTCRPSPARASAAPRAA
jgi:NADH-quinone oxidoreductase subunit N